MGEVAASRRQPAARRRPSALWVAHALAAAVVVIGLVVQIVRPLAPDLGPAPPANQWFDPAHLQLVGAYRGPLYAVGATALLLRLAVPCAVAFTPAGRRLSDAVVRRVGEHRPARAAAAVVLLVVVGTDLVVLPLVFWATFVHEGAFGFRTQGVAGWAYDWAVGVVPAWAVVGGLVVGGYSLARRVPRGWPPIAGLAATALTAGLVFGAPLVLEPLRFSTEPLPEGPVRIEVERILDRAGESVDRIVTADASRRTTKRNAYISGLGATGRVVLYDTLVARQPPAEVGVVLAHEIGHAQHADLARGTVFAGAGLITLVYLLAGVVRRRVASGRQASAADPRAAAVVLAIVVLAGAVALPVQNAASRRAEAAADLAALRITGEPSTYLDLIDGLARANLSDPRPPRWAQHLWSSHPPPTARLEMGRRWVEGPAT
ncbi:MAG: M48 family metalloprotease [Egibacteraceae bacterium]